MKQTVHPQWFPNANVSCACGNSFPIGATKEAIRVDICAKCHPFYTGEMKFVDSLGRVERFKNKQKSAEAQAAKLAEKKQKKMEYAKELRERKSLKDMLAGVR